MRARYLFGLALALFPITAFAQQYSFIVTGDCRSDKMPGRPGLDANGVNVKILKEQVKEIVGRHPKFVMFTGDLVHGYTTEDEFRNQLKGWLDLFRPVYDAGIHVYVVRGNHDAFSTNAMKVWNEVFTGRYSNPLNGPEGEKNCTFAGKEENALILGLDDWTPTQHEVDQAWLDEQLRTNKQPLIFAMGHEMAFKDGGHSDNLDNHEAARDRFIRSLWNAGARVYFAGHDHLYDHMEVTDPKRNAKFNLHQFVDGTAGAPFYHGSAYDGRNDGWKLRQIKHIEKTYGFLLVQVNGRKATIKFMGRNAEGKYVPMDTWAYMAKKQ